MNGLPDGFWCELVARSPDLRDEWYLAGSWATSTEDAFGWLRDRAERLTNFLGPSVGRVFSEWLEDAERQAVQCEALEAGLPISANAGASDHIAHTRDLYVLYSLTCRPVFTTPVPATGVRADFFVTHVTGVTCDDLRGRSGA